MPLTAEKIGRRLQAPLVNAEGTAGKAARLSCCAVRRGRLPSLWKAGTDGAARRPHLDHAGHVAARVGPLVVDAKHGGGQGAKPRLHGAGQEYKHLPDARLRRRPAPNAVSSHRKRRSGTAKRACYYFACGLGTSHDERSERCHGNGTQVTCMHGRVAEQRFHAQKAQAVRLPCTAHLSHAGFPHDLGNLLLQRAVVQDVVFLRTKRVLQRE